MTGPQCPMNVSTRLHRIAQASEHWPDRTWTTLAHHVDLPLLRTAYHRTRKSGAVGVDGVTAREYGANLDVNLQSLCDRFRSGRYRAPPVRRVHIPKADGTRRPIGIPTLEDKVLQQAVAMVMNAVYEQDFLACSYGFRPGRSAHDALAALRQGIMETWGGWVLDIDIASFFDTLDHTALRRFLDVRIRDGVLRRMVDKWLKAGVLEEGNIHRSGRGTPQGGVISPLLANIYLHHVLDQWFEQDVKPRMRGRAQLIRYADDCAMVFEHRYDAERVFAVLAKRLAKFGLELHPEKTRLVQFKCPPKDGPTSNGGPGTFVFLGFTHYWGRSRKGHLVVQRKTSKRSLRRSVQAISQWCRRNRHLSLREQQRVLSMKLVGHYRYFGITGNSRQLGRFAYCVRVLWRRWLGRRSNSGRMTWARFNRLWPHYMLPRPRIYYSYVANQ